ncbi:MAG TPA: hypothetical protein VG275_09155 [Solirubrobacteraceae bacterium]|nr:hypothetical protein [Solirubrobacteraceae bacterium]
MADRGENGHAGRHRARLQWKVSGWRRSSELVRSIAADLTAGRDLESVSTEERGLVR